MVTDLGGGRKEEEVRVSFIVCMMSLQVPLIFSEPYYRINEGKDDDISY